MSTKPDSSQIKFDNGTVQDVLDSAKPIADYTILRAYTGTATSVRITTPGIAGFFTRDSDVFTADNGGTVIVDASGRRWKRVFDGAVSVSWFGAVGDGVADDSVPLTKFFQAIQNGKGLLEAKTYYVASRITLAFSNTTLVGVPGKTKITSDYSNPTNLEQAGFIKLLDIDNLHVSGIEFNSTLSSTVFDSGSALVFSYQNSVKNSSFVKCKFSAPTANTSGISFFTRINSADAGATIDGLTVEDCVFESLGAIGSTIMNRGTGADKYQAARRIRFNNNHAYDLGTRGSFGFLVSLDGFGSDTEVNGNNLRKCLGIGIENTGWINSSFIGNMFSDFSRSYAPMSWSGNSMTGCRIEGNICQEDALVTTNFSNVNESNFAGNVWRASSAANNAAVAIKGSNNKFTRDRYKSASLYAAIVQSVTGIPAQLNEFDSCVFDNSASSNNFGTITFEGALCSGNLVKSAQILKGTGGFVALQQLSASENVIFDYTTSTLDAPYSYTLVTVPDSDLTISGLTALISYDAVRFNGTLTAGRAITLPKAWMLKPKRVLNTTGQTLTFYVGGAVGGTLANGASGTIAYDPTISSVRVI